MTYVEEIAEIERRIRDLEIQGARNVAIWGLRCLELAVKHAPASTPSQLIDTMGKIAREVSLIRVTEPMLRNVLATVLYEAKKARPEKVEDLRSMTLKLCSGLLDDLESSLSEIQRQGARVIKDGDTIFTHCHSSSVTKLIISQSEEKDIRVLCTETRPRWQGRKTARELAEAGIDVTLFVDSAARMFMDEADLVLIGADAVGGGLLYNKIGSYMVIHFANEAGVPAYSVCESRKFDPLIRHGHRQPVEERPPSEVIDGEVPFKVRNPAFETVPLEMFSGIITELGIVDPARVDELMERYEHLVPELEKLVNW